MCLRFLLSVKLFYVTHFFLFSLFLFCVWWGSTDWLYWGGWLMFSKGKGAGTEELVRGEGRALAGY